MDISCPNCIRTFKSPAALTKHSVNHYSCVCYYCNFAYYTKSDLAKHQQTFHQNNLLKWSCPICKNRSFKSKLMQSRHLRKYHDLDDKSIVCGICFDSETVSTFKNFDEFRKHYLEHPEQFIEDNMHEEYVEYLKEELPDTFDEEMDVPYSLIEVSPKKFSCSKSSCPGKYKTQYDLILHLCHDHDEKALICNQCSMKFNRLEMYEQHRKSHVKENKVFYELMVEGSSQEYEMVQKADDCMFQCKTCKKEFKLKMNYEQHTCFRSKRCKGEILNVQEFPCQICKLKFETRKECFKHQLSHAEGILDCNLCDKKFKTTQGLKYHLNQHLANKSFSCFYCTKKFAANVNLIAHIKTVHTTDKTYKCLENNCNKSFATMDHYIKHQKRHQNIRNYTCTVCDKKFLQKCHLTEHHRTQHEMSGFKCNFCDKVISTKYSLIRHMKQTHKNIIDS